jgi:serine/threonine-protein kinase
MLGRSLGNYGVVSKLGEGGMGVVYLAQHVTLGKKAAIKVLRPALSSNQDVVSRFFNEARAVTAVRNPGIVDVYDFGFLEDRTAYIIMEYLEGESLAARLRRSRPAIPWTLTVVRAITRALQAAHEHGIVHRDLKPDNVFLVPDADLPGGERVKLLDFGIAKLAHGAGDASHTTTGTVMGTPTYMAPEQCRGAGAVDHRADLYSLGCVAYEMLCGQPPFVADGPGDVIARHLYFAPQPPRSHRAEIPAELEEIVLRLLSKEPRARYATAAELVRAIDQLSGAPLPGAAPSKPLATEFVATLPVVRDTTLNGAASSRLSLGKDERSRRLGIVTAAVTVAVAAFVLVWFLARGNHGEGSSAGAVAALATEPKAPVSSAASPPLPAPTAPRPATGAESASPAAVERAQGSAAVPSGTVGSGTEAPLDPGPQTPAAPAAPADPHETASAISPETSSDTVSAEPPPEQPASAAKRPSEAGGQPDVARHDARRSETAKALPERPGLPRSRVGRAPHASTSLIEGPTRTPVPRPDTGTTSGKGPSPGDAVAPGPGSAAAAAPLDADCSPAGFAGVLDAKAPSKKAVRDARARLARCKPSMDPGVYDDIYRRLIELY